MASTAGSPHPRTSRLSLSGWAVSMALVGAIWALVVSCDDASTTPTTVTPPTTGDFDLAEMLQNLSDKVVRQTLTEFVTSAEALEAAARAHQAAPSSTAAADAARDAWRNAMVGWSKLELMQLGPAAGPGEPGGESMRDEIYSWPAVSACAVDQQIVSQSYADAAFIDNKLVNVYGLDALGYLLFHSGPDNQCASQSSINRDGLWDAIESGQLSQRRADYALAAAKGVVTRAKALADRWDPAQANFVAELSKAVTGESAVYSSASEAIDAVYAAMFFVDHAVKDDKLGKTTGLASKCATEDCGVEEVEAPWSKHSLENIIANLEGLQLLYFGGPPDGSGIGFDDYLRAREADSLATEIGDAINSALAIGKAMAGSLTDLLTSSPESVVALYDAIRAITTPFKNDVPVVLQVSVPTIGKGDTD